MNSLLFTLIALCFLSAQSTELELSFLSKTKSSPFWFTSNKYGFNPNHSFASLSHLSKGRNFKSYMYRFGIGINLNHRNFFFENNEVFFELKHKKLALNLGKFHSKDNSSSISTGSLVEGPNAYPISKILVSIPDFSQFKFLNFTFFAKGEFAHGWMNKESYIKAPFLHQKSLEIKKDLQKNSNFQFGLKHMVIWAGETKQHGKQPSGLDDFFRVVFALKGGKNSLYQEQKNSLGNHLGAWSFKYETIYDNKIIKLYMEHPFEDESGARWILNEFDGLYGFNIEKNAVSLISSFNYEYIHTMDQSGSEGASESTYGWDNYYNHYIYQSGWTNNGRVIGNPLFTLGSNKDRYSNNLYIINNRIKAHHIGAQGLISENVYYKMLFTYSENFGTFPDEYFFKSKNIKYDFEGGLIQRSGLFEVIIKNTFIKVDFSLGYGFDYGELLNKTDSFMLKINHKFEL